MKTSEERVLIEEPRLARLIFADTRFGWLWLPLRLYLGWAWFEANEQARDDYMKEVNPILEKIGLRIPDPLKGRRYM